MINATTPMDETIVFERVTRPRLGDIRVALRYRGEPVLVFATSEQGRRAGWAASAYLSGNPFTGFEEDTAVFAAIREAARNGSGQAALGDDERAALAEALAPWDGA